MYTSMFSYSNSLKKSFAGLFISALFVVALAPLASAQTYYYPVSYNQNNADIQSLVDQINTLLAQLQKMQSVETSSNYHRYYSNNTDGNMHGTHYNRYYTSNNDLSVTTGTAEVDSSDSVILSGNVTLDNASYAKVWFEYGTNGNLDEETGSERVTRDGSFTITLSNINNNQQYYFRAVAETTDGVREYGTIKSFKTNSSYNRHYNYNSHSSTPDVSTGSANNINRYNAELHGTIDMNDFGNGVGFFVYGENERSINAVENEDTYNNVSENGNSIQKVLLSSSLDSSRSFSATVSGLNRDSEHFFRICVAYKNDNNSKTLECGSVRSFTTDN